MTAITAVATGTAATGDYGPLAPALPVGAATGDTLLLYATCRNTAAVVATPSGWTPLLADGHVLLCGKYKTATEPAPAVTFTGGAAGDTVLAQISAWKTLDLSVNAGPAVLSNASGQHITLPSLTPARAGSLLLVLGWKQDDWASVTTLSGADAEIGEAFSTAGNDAGQVWAYDIQTAAAAAPAGPFNVNGGAAAISKGYVIALNQAAAISAAQQDVYPPRVQVSVTNLVIGDSVAIYRVVGGVRTLIQAGFTDSVADPSFLRIDAMLPFGVPVSYVAEVNGVDYSTSATTYTLPGGKVVISDAIAGLAAEVVIDAWPEKAYDPQATVFKPAGRNVVVSGVFGQWEGDLELSTETTAAADQLRLVLATATQGVVQLRQPGGYDGVDSYFAFTSYRERRYSQDGSDQKRIHIVHALEVDGWAAALAASGFTYQDLADAYAGLTYANLAADYPTYLALAQGDFS
jgi:hypothetical protein